MAYNAYILSYPRSGSSYFMNVLNSTGLFDPILDEHLHPGKDEIFLNHKLLINNYLFVNNQFTLKEISERYPSIKFIHLKRRDIIGRTVSLFFIIKDIRLLSNGDYYIKPFRNSLKNKIMLLSLYNALKIHENKFDEIIKKNELEVLTIYYSDIMANKKKEFSKVFKYLDIDVSLVDFALSNTESAIIRQEHDSIYSEVKELLIKVIG